ncbi:ABC transporter ATP-binding protein [Saccharomonospora sp. NPDC046836]|uniref:ABC transporter ATP-binding protein n=1 Tax=Saccharomonospora sp. NPDC046836 TaxID=3156921 RepID=UPI0033C24397
MTNDTAAAVPRASGKGSPKVQFCNLAKRFHRKGREVSVMNDLNLSIAEGEFVSFVGPSGCGKSTILNMTAGLMSPTRGQVLYQGVPVPTPNTNVGYITQNDNLLPWKTVAGNVGLALEIAHVGKAEREQRIKDVVELVGLAGFESAYPAELSGGMRKRVTLARTLVYKPEVVLADEPFGALDAQLKLIMQQELLDIWAREGMTVIFITHDIAEAVALSGRVIVLSKRPTRMKIDRKIDLPRPRDVANLRFTKAFGDIYQELWDVLGDDIREGESV